jgi:hypothetical protein
VAGELPASQLFEPDLKIISPDSASPGVVVQMNDHPTLTVLKRLDEPHLHGFDPADASEFLWPVAMIKAYDRIEAEKKDQCKINSRPRQ